MAIVYIEARPKGRQEGTAIDDYVIEDPGRGNQLGEVERADASRCQGSPSERQEDPV
jgi:hypothetical protein